MSSFRITLKATRSNIFRSCRLNTTADLIAAAVIRTTITDEILFAVKDPSRHQLDQTLLISSVISINTTDISAKELSPNFHQIRIIIIRIILILIGISTPMKTSSPLRILESSKQNKVKKIKDSNHCRVNRKATEDEQPRRQRRGIFERIPRTIRK